MPFITPRSLSKSLPKSRALLCAPSENCSIQLSGRTPRRQCGRRPSRYPPATSQLRCSAAQRSQALQDRACPLSLYFLICKQEMRAPLSVAGKRTWLAACRGANLESCPLTRPSSVQEADVPREATTSRVKLGVDLHQSTCGSIQFCTDAEQAKLTTEPTCSRGWRMRTRNRACAWQEGSVIFHPVSRVQGYRRTRLPFQDPHPKSDLPFPVSSVLDPGVAETELQR